MKYLKSRLFRLIIEAQKDYITAFERRWAATPW